MLNCPRKNSLTLSAYREFFRVAFLKGEYFVSDDDSVTKCDTRLNSHISLRSTIIYKSIKSIKTIEYI